jgi:pSer/pThr/pTyr-binding forkhead associated (FHA) protein
MAGPKDNVLDRAESAARRVLQRLGSKLDARFTTDDQRALSLRKIGDLTSRIEHLIESSLQEDDRGVRRVAPNRFHVVFTYEETSVLSAEYIQAMANELTALASEYIANRRYTTRGPVIVGIGGDVFAKQTEVKGTFESGVPAQAEAAGQGPNSRAVTLVSSSGRRYQVELKREGAPAYLGRAAGNAIRIDDPSVSRLHCSLALRANGDLIVADLGSANGTCVNDTPLAADEARTIKTGDVIGVGDFKFTVSEIL